MKNKLASQDKIMIITIGVLLLMPILASLSYAEFVEHLWPIDMSLQTIGYDSNRSYQTISDSASPDSNMPEDYSVRIIEEQDPYVIVAATGILGISFYLVFRGKKMNHKIHS